MLEEGEDHSFGDRRQAGMLVQPCSGQVSGGPTGPPPSWGPWQRKFSLHIGFIISSFGVCMWYGLVWCGLVSRFGVLTVF